MIYKVELLLDEPTKVYGRIYNKKMVTSAITTMRSSKLASYVTLELDDNTVDVNNAVTITHIVRDLYIENNTLMAELNVLETPSSQMFAVLSDAKAFLIRPIGTGIVKDNVVSDYTLHRLGIFFD